MICGAGILAASTNAVVEAGHLAGADATLVAALAAGVAAGSIVAPRAQRGLAFMIIAALFCGEAFNLLSAAERIIAARETAAASITGGNEKHALAQLRLANAEKARDKRTAEARSTVSLPGCGVQCRTLLQAQLDKLEFEVADARAALDRVPVMRSATPLADRIGVKPWVLDLIAAALLSLGANGLAAVLIAFGSRPGPQRGVPVLGTPQTAATAAVPRCPSAPTAADHGYDHDPKPPKGGLPVPVSPRTRGLLILIEGNGGTVAGSQRQLAQRAGLSKTALGRALADLAEAGLVEVAADRMSGTRITLRAA